MILEQGRIIEFDRYMQCFFPVGDDEKANQSLIACPGLPPC